MTSDARCKTDIKARLHTASVAAAKLTELLRSDHLSNITKLRLIKTLIFPVATYGSEAWTLSKARETNINAFETKLYRRVLRISYKDHVTNEEVFRQLDVKMADRILSAIRRKKLTYFGRVCLMKGDRLLKIALEGTMPGGRSRGRPRRKWLDNIKELTQLLFNESRKMTQDRKLWKERISEVSATVVRY